MKSEGGSRTGKDKVRRKAPIKVVLRRLPGGFDWSQLLTQLEPLPETESLQFVPANSEEEEYKFARAYFVFKNDEDIVAFRDRFNGYVFVDSQGVESVGLVELAPNPKVARNRREDSKKRDRRCGTIESDAEFKQFLDDREHPLKVDIPSVEDRVKEIEEKEKMQIENTVQETPLTQFMIRRSDERFRRLQDKRRVRDEEKKARLQRLFEKEQKERTERKEAKKITEFRNSKIDPSLFRGSSHREGKKVKEDSEKETSKSKGEQDWNSKPTRYRSESSLKKERETLQKIKSSKERDVHADRSGDVEKNEKAKTAVLENGSRATKEELNEGESDLSERSSLPSRKSSNVRSSKEGVESSADTDKKPRRNKDRPERAIYQPSAVRRRMALNASTKVGDQEKKVQKPTELSEKR
ncbi:unnamed protein product [Enterobius vermicularis]|uniref:Smg4_UPF3 domain-containing protein n=1 Tax=Enterobius vermicularis TaxID=51028 RepID=A0A158Q9Q5_ENTVE|nr:unnamed protein product [Enterobius vermicularis]